MKFIKLEVLCSIITDGTHQTPTYSNEGYIFLSSKNVTSRKIDWDNVKYVSEELHNQLSKRLKPQRNDILLAKNGTTGVAAIVDRDEVFDIYVSLALLRPKEIIYPQYLLHVINSPMAKRQFNKSLKGIGVPNLHLKEIRNVEIPVPDNIENQKKIVEVLDKAQELIDKRKEQIEALDELVKSRFIEMFGNPLNNPKGWQETTLDYYSNLVTYGLTVRPDYIDIGIPLISAKEIRSGVVGYNDAPKISIDDYNKLSDKGKPKKNDILFSKTGSIGHCAIVDSEEIFAITQNAARISLDLNRINPLWCLYYLRTDYIQEWCQRKSKGNAVKDFQLQDMKKIPIFICDKKLQDEFVDFIKQVNKLKFEMETSLKELEDNFNSLMQKAFKGELYK